MTREDVDTAIEGSTAPLEFLELCMVKETSSLLAGQDFARRVFCVEQDRALVTFWPLV